jgi:hypothetical protein
MEKLRERVRTSREVLRPFREERELAIREYAGPYYGKRLGHRIPTNFLSLFVDIHVRQLAAHAPRVLATTEVKGLHPFAKTVEKAINYRLKEIVFEDTVQRWVKDALFRMGILRVAEEHYDTDIAEGETEETGVPLMRPHLQVISLDDWVHDAAARVGGSQLFRNVTFCGHIQRQRREVFEELKFIPKKVRDKFLESGKSMQEGGERRAEDIPRGRSFNHEDYDPIVEWFNLWLPREKKIVWLPMEGSTKPLHVMDWNGPEHGPYHLLGFATVPDSPMPKSVIDDVLDLHYFANNLMNKMENQARRQKILNAFRGTPEDAQRANAASDGDWFHLENPEGIKEVSLGGADPMSMTLFLQVRQLISYLGGNMDIVGGLGAQSETATQDQMLGASAGMRLEDMQDRTMSATKRVVEALAEYAWHDEAFDPPLYKRIEGLNLALPTSFAFEDRQGKFPDYHIKLEPYSMRDQSPESRARDLMQLVTQIVLPLMQTGIPQQQGITLDLSEVLRLYSGYKGIDDIERILTLSGEEAPLEATAQAPRQAANTTRTNIRENRPSGVQSSQENALAQQLMGMAAQRRQPTRGVV